MPVFVNFSVSIGRTMSLLELAAVFVSGGAILSFCSTVTGIVGQRTGLSSGLLTMRVFGTKAGSAISLATAILILGRDSFILDLLGTEFVNVFGTPEYRPFFIFFAMTLFVVTTTGGFRFLAWMSIIAVPLMLGLMLYALLLAATRGGAAFVAADRPSISFSIAVTETVGLFALGSIMCSPDIQRFCKTTCDAAVIGAVTFVLALPTFLLVGGVAALLTGTSSLLTSFAAVGALWIGLVVFVLVSWSCCDNDYYSASLNLAGISGVRKAWLVPPAAIAAATVATLSSALARHHDHGGDTGSWRVRCQFHHHGRSTPRATLCGSQGTGCFLLAIRCSS